MNDIAEIQSASRQSLIAYLESWGFQCYDHESDGELRATAEQNFATEGAGAGPVALKAGAGAGQGST